MSAIELKADELLPGTKYRIVKSLGAGGMGVVYQVVKPPNIQGVLKVMSGELAGHEEHRTRFFDEVRILAQLDHPNIVRVFDYDALADGTPYYVMELLNGRTVREVIHAIGRVPPRVAYEITRQLLEALQAAHTHEVPVIHRDVKPENIFLHAPKHGEPVVKLIDFGVSAVADRKHDGSFVGTWSYAAPEQIRGELPTPATDLYAAGLVLYEMLSGIGPFDHYTDWAEVSEAQLNEVPMPVSQRAPWVPASIDALIQSALAKDPKARPRDAYAFAERLFELEWASDGKDPHDQTVEGRGSVRAMKEAARAAAEEKPTREVDVPAPAPGPLSRILSSVTSVRASSKNMAAASPAPDRLGDVPLIGVPPEAVRRGPTWAGVGGQEFTSPDAQDLLEGLGKPSGAKPVSKKERESNPELGVAAKDAKPEAKRPGTPDSPRTPRVIVRDPDAKVEADATTMQAPEIGSAKQLPRDAESGRELPSTRDTFSSQQSDPGPIPVKGRTGPLLLAAALLAVGLALAAVIIKRSERSDTPVSAALAEPPSSIAATRSSLAPAPRVVESAKPVETAPAPAPAASAPLVPSTTHASPPAGAGKPKGAGAKKAATTEGAASAAPGAGRAPTPAQSASSSGDFIRVF